MKSFKRFLLLILVLCLSLCSVFALASCDESENGNENGGGGNGNSEGNNGNGENSQSVEYEVIVVDSFNVPVEGAKISLTIDGKQVVSKTETNAEGKVIYSASKEAQASVRATVDTVPSKYTKPNPFKNIDFESGSKSLTIVLGNKDCYTVTVKDQNGDAVVGVKLQLCFDQCLAEKPLTDENGNAYFYYNNNDQSLVPYATILELPSGYSLGDLDENEPKVYFDMGEKELEIIVVKDN